MVDKTQDEEIRKETADNDEEELEVVEDTSEDDEFDFDDSDDVAEEGNDDSLESKKKKQSKEENHKYAELRRKQQLERESKIKSDSFKEGLMEGIEGVNPYTNKKIEDDEDYEIYQTMREIEKRGGDPVDEYIDYVKIFKKEEKERLAKANEAENKMKQQISDNISSFQKKYPDIDLKKLMSDERFKKFGIRAINAGVPISDVYEDFIGFTSNEDNLAESKARKAYAKKMSSAGSLTNTGEEKTKSVSSMTDTEFLAYKKKLGL